MHKFVRLEKYVQNDILTWLKVCGFLAFPIPNRGQWSPISRRYNIKDKWLVPGVPDIIVVLDSQRVVWIETKSEIGRLSLRQKDFHSKLEILGHLVCVARSVEDVRQAFKGWGILT